MTDCNKLLISHINDLINSVKKGRKYAFTSFLNEEQLSCVVSYAAACKADFSLYGGYCDADRCVVGFGSDEPPQDYIFPVSALTFEYPAREELLHRHVLGSLMSLGIKRELIGDIIFNNNKCIFFADSKIADYICMNLTSVSSIGVDVCITDEEINYVRSYEEMLCIVASLRLDCVVGGLSNKSRTNATEYIESGLVYVNGIQCQKKDKMISVGDVISIRRVGKFRVDSDDGNTKKNRVKLKILKYI